MMSQKGVDNNTATKASTNYKSNKLTVTITKANGETQVKEVEDALDFSPKDF